VFDFNNNVFGGAPKPSIPPTAKVVFVADFFAEDLLGGAELTSQALIDSSPFEIAKLHSRDVTMELLQQGADKFWIFGNFTELNPQLIPTVVANLRYSILEYDYKYCRARSPEKHLQLLGTPCDCANQMNGKIISAFFYGAMGTWWMSEKQREKYLTLFPFLADKDSVVLSSVFDDQTLGTIKLLRSKYAGSERKGWLVLGSNSWIKGTDAAKAWCEANGKSYEVVSGLSYEAMLDKLAQAEGLVYLPPGGDTCPRMVIEAKLLGCQLHLNDNVQHKDEEWFATDNLVDIEDYLHVAKTLFWTGIKKMMDYRASVSGYTTTLNCVEQEYPFEQCIRSMLQFCDEVCVVDGGSTDGTLDRLNALAASDERVKVKVVPRDWNHPRFAVFDGMQKAEARAMCTKDFCWQMDSDEIVHEDDAPRITEMCRSMPKEVPILALPVIEYWGGPDKVRCDIQPWKWRLSRNHPDITHGIPAELRRQDDAGDTYAAEGTDGCDMISKETGERYQFMSFYTPEVEQVRRVAMLGNEQARAEYERWFTQVVNGLPCVFHYSWYDLPRKIKLYKKYWTKHWNSLFNKSTADTAENNMMFDVPWSEVTDEMIEARAQEFKEKLGGWVWHRKWTGVSTPHIQVSRTQPKVML
jgi:glycosyltransferase involved in cell wall biosynthesis